MLCNQYKKGTTEACHLCEIVTCGSEPCELTENIEPRIKDCYGILRPCLVWERWLRNPREVNAYRTTRPGQVKTLEGAKDYEAGDYLVESPGHFVYSVGKDFFEQAYTPGGMSPTCKICERLLVEEPASNAPNAQRTYICSWCNTRWGADQVEHPARPHE
jgi:hypothetical protein